MENEDKISEKELTENDKCKRFLIKLNEPMSLIQLKQKFQDIM